METLIKSITNEKKYFGFERIRQGWSKTIPVSFSVVTYGFLFGVLAGQAGLNSLEGTLMSAFVFAGASQLIVLVLWTQPLPDFYHHFYKICHKPSSYSDGRFSS